MNYQYDITAKNYGHYSCQYHFFSEVIILQAHHVYSMLKRRGNDRFRIPCQNDVETTVSTSF